MRDDMDMSDTSSMSSGRSTPSISRTSSAIGTPATEYSPSPDGNKGIWGRSFFQPALADDARPTNNTSAVKSICCIGAGYVGGPTAAIMALKNPHMTINVADLNANRIRKWNSNHLPVHEPGLLDVVRIARDGVRSRPDRPAGSFASTASYNRRPNLFFTTDVETSVKEADIILLSVNTPTKTTGIGAGAASNLVAVEGAVVALAKWAKPGAIIVEKSTVPCRTAKMIRELLAVHRPDAHFEVLSNPEFLAEGTAVTNLLTPDRVLIGSSKTTEGLAAAAALKNVYSAWIDPDRIITVNLWSSELAKLVANAMLAQRISSINSISAVCEKTGADIAEIATALGKDTRLGSKFLQAGLGFGGSCFKKDILNLAYMAQSLHLPEVAEYWLQVLKMNDYQRDRFVQTVVKTMNSALNGKKIAILGWAFKENTNDTRESPALEVVRSLLAESPREIAIYDPGCNPTDILDEVQELIASPNQDLRSPTEPIRAVEDAFEACRDADAILLLTPWDQFRYPPKAISTPQGRKLGPSPSSISPITSRHDPLGLGISETEVQYLHERTCELDCRDCSGGQTERRHCSENVPWADIAEVMRKPRMVFDARGLVDVSLMEGLGFAVKVIGRVESTSPLA
ncbi:Hypothetical protein D9617_10g071920 [Elsinoe fawcettii]|nr:Hypothetical protein D9617_10g071920 [Elsinoe fawcettii]